MAQVNGIALAGLAAGGLFLFSGIKGKSITQALQYMIQGKNPSGAPQANPVSGTGTPSGPGSASGTVTAQGGSPSGTSQKANQALGRLMAGSYGWATGTEWTALNNIVMAESGWDNQAQNPTSTAYGIFQFLDTTWASVGYTKSSDPVVQIAAGLAYIKQRYSDPVKAWQFHLANGWY